MSTLIKFFKPNFLSLNKEKGIIKVYVRKLFKLKNDGKKEYETNPNPL